VKPTAGIESAMNPSPQPIDVLEADGRPRLGFHASALAPFDVRTAEPEASAGALWRATRHKRWVWLTLVTEQYLLALAVVHLGWGATAFVYVLDRRTRAMLMDRSYVAVLGGCSVSDGCEQGCEVRFRALRCAIDLRRERGSSSWRLEARAHELTVCASFDSEGAPGPIATIGQVPDGGLHLTEKRALMPAMVILKFPLALARRRSEATGSPMPSLSRHERRAPSWD